MPAFDLAGLRAFLTRWRYALAGGALILLGVAARLALTLAGWPHTNSEEGAMGVEATNIFLHGGRPIYFYGQQYMGVGEAYLGALAFNVFGISVASLRVGMLLLYAAFMLGVWWMADQLYSRRVALAALAVLVSGAPFAVRIQLLADGGKAETLAFGALMMALAAWLAITPPPVAPTRGQRARRIGAWVAWGLLAGLGLYTYAIVAPFVLTSGALLALTRWRELRSWRAIASIAGLLAGLLPAILYTITSPLDQNPIAVFLALHQSLNAHGAPGGPPLLVKQVIATLLYTLPQVTGLPAQYPVSALPLYGPPTAATLTAVALGGAWSAAWLALLGVAIWRDLTPWPPLLRGEGETRKRLARLALALAGGLTLAAYLFSATAANNPASGRYLIGLLIVTPALLWPLLERRGVAAGGARTHKFAPGGPHGHETRLRGSSPAVAASAKADVVAAGPMRREFMRLRHLLRPRGAPAFARATGARVALLGLLAVSLALDVAATIQGVPAEAAAGQRDATFIQDLTSHGITRFYADYWTCDVVNFESQGRLVCAVVDTYARPGLTRYAPFAAEVRADPAAPYILAHGSEIERTFLIHAANTDQRYTLTHLDGKDVYTPAGMA